MGRNIWFAAISLALLAAGCGESSSTNAPAVSAAAAPAASAPTAPVTPASSSTSVSLPSVLTVEHEVDVMAQRDGTVMEILKDEGSNVKSGDVLAQLDDRDMQAQLEKDKDDLKVAEYNVQYNEAELKAKQAGLRRAQQMRDAGLNSEADLEQAQFLAKGAEYDLASWHAAVEKSHAAIKITESNLDMTKIRAPFSGVVARRYIRQGQGVTKGDKSFHVSQMSPLLVVFAIPESAGAAPRIGEKLNVVAGESSASFPARIIKISPTIDPASGAYEATAELGGSGLGSLRPGMAARVMWPPAATTSGKH
jgi:membrane fusion protein, multidrug efflux system